MTHCPREQPSSQEIEDNRSTLLPSASSQCSSAVLWLYQRLSAYPSALVGFAVRSVGTCYDRSISRWHTVIESIEIGPLHRTLRRAGFRLQATGYREQPNSRTNEDNRSTSFPSASSQCSLAVLWLYQRLSAYPGSLVGFAVRSVGPCYDRSISRWHTSPQ